VPAHSISLLDGGGHVDAAFNQCGDVRSVVVEWNSAGLLVEFRALPAGRVASAIPESRIALVVFANDVSEARKPAEPLIVHRQRQPQAGIVVRYNDGRMLKGFGRDSFRPKVRFMSGRGRTRRHSHAYLAADASQAVFFVHDFAGATGGRDAAAIRELRGASST
jgi:hypothetical protein